MRKNALLNALIVTFLTHVLYLAQQQYKSIYKLDQSQQMAPPSHQSQNPTQFPLLPRKSLGKQIGKIHKYTHMIFMCLCVYACAYIDTHLSLYMYKRVHIQYVLQVQ